MPRNKNRIWKATLFSGTEASPLAALVLLVLASCHSWTWVKGISRGTTSRWAGDSLRFFSFRMVKCINSLSSLHPHRLVTDLEWKLLNLKSFSRSMVVK